ncbi:MAG: single-stranded DNA-binding protein [Gammaproteobacteria bacterium]|nr:MAG: single-stranded DNA-binding protein [Gammaproteobacteria bacterium]
MSTKASKAIEHEESVLVNQDGKQLTAAEVRPIAKATPAPVIVDQNPYVQMIAVAAAKDIDVEKLEKLMGLQEKWEQRQEKKEYIAALAGFSENPPTVTKDRDNSQYESRYASLGNTVKTLVPHLSKFGLTPHWDIKQTEGVSVTCVLSHVAGHSETVTISAPPDTSGKKNPIQQIKSTITYLRLATLEAVTGTASEDGCVDDDGNSSIATVSITPEQAAKMRDELTALEGDEKFFCQWLCKVDSFDDVPEKLLDRAQKAIKERKAAQS